MSKPQYTKAGEGFSCKETDAFKNNYPFLGCIPSNNNQTAVSLFWVCKIRFKKKLLWFDFYNLKFTTTSSKCPVLLWVTLVYIQLSISCSPYLPTLNPSCDWATPGHIHSRQYYCTFWLFSLPLLLLGAACEWGSRMPVRCHKTILLDMVLYVV